MNKQIVKEPPFLLSLIPVFVLVALLFVAIRTFGADALSGGNQIILLTAAAVCCAIAMFYCKTKWSVIENSISSNIFGVSPAIFILLIIGALSGTWMISGIVPTFIYYGIQIIHPSFYLVSTCIICAIVSVMIGSSWTTIATIGVALLGIGQVQGFSTGWIAGAIISGAYFGDKISPLSDTTILASSITDTPLFTHIRYMMITTIPSMIIALIIFTVAGLSYNAVATDRILLYTTSLKQTFNISAWLLIIPAATFFMIIKKVPAIITLFLSAMMAGIAAVVVQPHLLHEISGHEISGITSQFKGLLMTFYGSTSIETGSAELNNLVSTRGMAGMMDTVWLIICAMAFGGAMTASGMLKSITSAFIHLVRRTVSMVASTVGCGLFLTLTTADQYIAIVLNGNMFKDIYKKRGYESRLLSRTTEDAVTVISPLVPWNTCGMTQSTILGVSTFTYLPYCFFNIISPLMSITIAALGYKIFKIETENEEEDILDELSRPKKVKSV
ncbi:MAG: sodium:proton antiporter [Prevotellaceae bacterium]|jgi:NhaC family Na+:H+ antiporter|nr:sodium:proton antiporter [Prevotellaceae bacterium]